MSKTIIISNRLPIKIIQINDQYTIIPSEGGLATGLADIYKKGDIIWIGWPGIDIPEERQAEVTELLAPLKLIPVYLSQEEINLFYEGFSNETLWPIFHYMVTYARYEQAYWDAYKQVNQKFALACSEVFKENDRIWVQDYQLLLLPAMLRAQFKQASIGFFQHIPFPSYEIFRLIPWREELVDGLLGADLLGFHTFDDVRHFLDTASRILPTTFSANILSYENRQIIVEAFPMGIDFEKFENLSSSMEVQTEMQSLIDQKETKIILSIDRLDYSKGILERLKAYELLLTYYPAYIGRVSLYMVVVPSRDAVAQYKELKEQIDQLVGNINARFRTLNWIPVNYFYRSFNINMLSAFYNLADICLVTPMRDGMNLVSKEYVASRQDNSGVLILSEMAGASKELTDALVINPNNLGHIIDGIITALNMPLEEQQARMKNMRAIVKKFNVSQWVKNFLSRLQEAKQLQESMWTKHAVKHMDTSIIKSYKKATCRTIFLDYDGTLVGFSGNINDAKPDEELYEIIDRLTTDPLNTVVIISGRNHQTLKKWFENKKVDLIAEHGAWQRKHGKKWSVIPFLKKEWKDEFRKILEIYTDRTPGSFIEEKSYSLVWHYRKAEKGLGELRAGEIMNHLRIIAADQGIQMMPGNKVIELRNMEVNKGRAALTWLYENKCDFLMAMGDDHTDEDIFKSLPEEAFTIKVGNNLSSAKYFLHDYKEVRSFLLSLLRKETSGALI